MTTSTLDAPLRHAEHDGTDIAFFELGEGPLAVCVHGYPDTPHTWRHLLPELAEAGFRAVAPALRGYAPSGLAADGIYLPAASSLDINALHEVLGGDGDAVLVGHDWGALIAYGAAGIEPHRWRRLATMAVPPGPVAAAGMFGQDQLRRSWYIFFQLWAHAESIVMADGFAHIERLWRDWSPGYDPTEDVAHFVAAMPDPAHVSAALGIYRQTLDLANVPEAFAAAQMATIMAPPQPLLYLHGTQDGCMGIELADGTPGALVGPGSRYERLEGVGHFLHLEAPERVNRLIVGFLTE